MKKGIVILFVGISLLCTSSISMAQSGGMTPEKAAVILAHEGIIRQRASLDEYRVNQPIWRQEMIGIALNLAHLEVDQQTPCLGIYLDVTRSIPNSWICKVAELAAENNIITKGNDYPRVRARLKPERNVSRSEAFSMILSSLNVPLMSVSDLNLYLFPQDAVLWQKRVIATAHELNMTSSTSGFAPNRDATRGEIFLAIVQSMNLDSSEGEPQNIEDLLNMIRNVLQ